MKLLGPESSMPTAVSDVVASALGQSERHDPVLPSTGGPAGNARLTAWTGLVMLALIAVELVTLLDMHGLLSWHVAVGALLGPPALAKTGSTGWRLVRYYSRHPAYRAAGPPPWALRLLGPIVVGSTWALIGTGVALVLLGRSTSHTVLLTVLGQRIDWVTLHQASFVVWAVATGVHVLARLLPAYRLTFGSRATAVASVPGSVARVAVLGLAVAVGIVGAVLLVHTDGSWSGPHDDVSGLVRGGPPG